MREMMDILHVDLPQSVTADVLIAAAWNGKIKNLELLLRINPDVNMTNPAGLAALHAAAHQGHAEICEMLLRKGSFVDYPDQGAPSPLHLAASQNHVGIVQMLHQHGASLFRSIENNKHHSPAVYSRYFWHSYRVNLPHAAVMSESLLESPIEAAVYASDVDSDHTSTYMVRNGIKLPPLTVYIAVCYRIPHLLSLALQQDLNPDHLGPDGFTPLQRALMNVKNNEKSASVQIVSDLLEAGAMIRGGEAILALSNLGSWDIVLKILSSDHQGVAERLDCIPPFITVQNGPIGKILLETAILEGSEYLIEHVFALRPSEYSAGALCAACFQAARGGSSLNILALLGRLLQNRAKAPTRTQGDSVCETTAVGIAAWTGSSSMLEILHAYIPIAHLAYIPNGKSCIKLPYIVAEHGSTSPLAFWHQARADHSVGYHTGSPVNFALDKPKIVDQLLSYGYKIDRMSLVIMANSGDTSALRSLVQDQDILNHKLASGNHSPLYHAITNGDMEMMTLLLDLGEDVNDNEYRNDLGRSPLARAVEMNNLSMIDLLMKSRADVNMPPARFHGKTALQCAAAEGLLGIAKRLVEHGADINAHRCRMEGLTALEAAAEHGRIDMIQFLLSEGVETTGNGRYQYVAAIHRAELNGHSVAENILKGHRPWTDEDQILWEREDLLEDNADEWARDDEYESCTDSDSEEETESIGACSATEDTGTMGTDDGMDRDSSNSISRSALLANNLVTEPGFAIETDSMDVDAIDWDVILAGGATAITEDVMN